MRKANFIDDPIFAKLTNDLQNYVQTWYTEQKIRNVRTEIHLRAWVKREPR